MIKITVDNQPPTQYDSLKELQLKVITSFLAGNDVFAVLPMGYGKSLCYACYYLITSIDYRGFTEISSDCCYPTHSYNGRPGKLLIFMYI